MSFLTLLTASVIGACTDRLARHSDYLIPGTEPEYKSWHKEQLKEWLDEHNVNVPKGASQEQLSELVQSNWYAGQAWTEKQVEAARGHYDNLKESAFNTYVCRTLYRHACGVAPG